MEEMSEAFDIIDTHCHLHTNAGAPAGYKCVGDSELSPEKKNTHGVSDVAHHISMGIKEEDWLRVIEYSALSQARRERKRGRSIALPRDPTYIGEGYETGEEKFEGQANRATSLDLGSTGFFQFGLGLHPWYAHTRSAQWLEKLCSLLEEYPQAIVGEIGLDKVAKTPDTLHVEWSCQVKVFHEQMALAARLARPVSVHCVKAYGPLLDLLQSGGQVSRTGTTGGSEGGRGGDFGHLPPRIALQLKLGGISIFFGFSAAVNMRGGREIQKLKELLQLIPDSQVLVETDRHRPEKCSEDLANVCAMVASAKGLTLGEAVMLVNTNALSFLAPLKPPPLAPPTIS